MHCFFVRVVTLKFQVSLYGFILDSMDAALCEDFKMGLLFKFQQAVPEILHFMYPQKWVLLERISCGFCGF